MTDKQLKDEKYMQIFYAKVQKTFNDIQREFELVK